MEVWAWTTSCARGRARGIVQPFQAEGEGREEDLMVGVGMVICGGVHWWEGVQGVKRVGESIRGEVGVQVDGVWVGMAVCIFHNSSWPFI